MFSGLLTQLRADVSATERILGVHERLRELMLGAGPPLAVDGAAPPAAYPPANCIEELRTYVGALPSKLDWQIYDHSAGITRLYAAYERFVNDLVSAYVGMLPELYRTAGELPETIAVNHRIGIGQILVRIGSHKRHKDIEETAVIRALSAGLGGETHYTLIPEAFLVERLNYRMDVLGAIFGNLGFEETGRQISSHPSVAEFMRTTRGESDTAQGELDSFVKYRNEASHGTPEQILARDEIKKIGHFIIHVCSALADMVADEVARRHMQLGNSTTVASITEIHYRGAVVVARMNKMVLSVGDELFIYSDKICRRTKVESIQVNNQDLPSVEGQQGQEVGIRLSARARGGAELRRLDLPSRVVPTQLALEDIPPEALQVGPSASTAEPDGEEPTDSE
jgi:hypothetical protein